LAQDAGDFGIAVVAVDFPQRFISPVAGNHFIVSGLPFQRTHDQRLQQAVGPDQCHKALVGLTVGPHLAGVAAAGDQTGQRNAHLHAVGVHDEPPLRRTCDDRRTMVVRNITINRFCLEAKHKMEKRASEPWGLTLGDDRQIGIGFQDREAPLLGGELLPSVKKLKAVEPFIHMSQEGLKNLHKIIR
jgi:hypothetical protein